MTLSFAVRRRRKGSSRRPLERVWPGPQRSPSLHFLGGKDPPHPGSGGALRRSGESRASSGPSSFSFQLLRGGASPPRGLIRSSERTLKTVAPGGAGGLGRLLPAPAPRYWAPPGPPAGPDGVGGGEDDDDDDDGDNNQWRLGGFGRPLVSRGTRPPRAPPRILGQSRARGAGRLNCRSPADQGPT